MQILVCSLHCKEAVSLKWTVPSASTCINHIDIFLTIPFKNVFGNLAIYVGIVCISIWIQFLLENKKNPLNQIFKIVSIEILHSNLWFWIFMRYIIHVPYLAVGNVFQTPKGITGIIKTFVRVLHNGNLNLESLYLRYT